MDWNRLEGNWKQFKGTSRRSGVGSPTTTSTSSMGGKTSSRARFRNATALPKTRPKRMSMLGSRHCREHPGRLAVRRVPYISLLAHTEPRET